MVFAGAGCQSAKEGETVFARKDAAAVPRFDLNLLASLDALLSERNVTAAAERIGVSQPTMSGMLNRLREQLQDPLLVRVGTVFELTPRAAELSEEVHQLLLRVDELVIPRVHVELDKVKRHFVIMASEYSLLLVLPYIFKRAANEAPGLTFEVVPIDDPADRVYSGTIDFCLTGNITAEIEGAAANVIRTNPLLAERFVGLVDKAHPVGDRLTLEEFLVYPHVATQFPGILQTIEDRGIHGFTVTHPPRIRVPSFMAIGAMLTGTDMIGVLQERMVPLLPAAWNLRTVELPPDFAHIAFRSLWHSRYDQDPVHRWLRTMAVEACAALQTESK